MSRVPVGKINPVLLKELDLAAGNLVTAVIQMRYNGEAGANISSDDTASLAKELLNRVAVQVHMREANKNVLCNLGAMVVRAAPEFIRSLIDQPEVIYASPNQMAESPVIPPHAKRPVK